MGEVYRARDTRLDRLVAIKILPGDMALDPEERERLRTEARAVSAINHPHICTLHDIGHQERPAAGTMAIEYLVMELLQGETLAERLVRGPLPLDQILRTGMEIASALDAAHAQGVTHRDLKPSNVMLMKAGVKLLDFGIAKIHRGAVVVGVATQKIDSSATADGQIVGTWQYMAPEQLEGKDIDARADIFALGAVLYEMATGRRAFEGQTRASLTAAIMEREPVPPSSLQPALPHAFDSVVRRCLAKDPEERWQSARDVQFQLRWIAEQGAGSTIGPGRSSGRLAWGFAGVATLVALAAVAVGIERPAADVAPGQFHISLPPGSGLPPREIATTLAVSPDGRHIAFAAAQGSQTRLWVRPLDSLTARSVPGTENARHPFWSPDSRTLGFFADGKLRRVDLSGGPPQVICEAPVDTVPTWGRDDTILFAEAPDQSAHRLGGIYRVSAKGGPVTEVTTVNRARDEREHYWPSFLPDGVHFLYLATIFQKQTASLRHAAYMASLHDQAITHVADVESRMVYAPPGYVVYAQDGALLARGFDSKLGRVTSDPFQIAEQIWYFRPAGMAEFSVSETGVLAYHGGKTVSELVWFDRTGKQLGTIGARASFTNVRLSPDGRKIAVAAIDARSGSSDVWIYDRESEIPIRFTADDVDSTSPVWSADGRHVFFRSILEPPPDVFWKRSDGRGGKELMVQVDGVQGPADVSLDGRYLVYYDMNRISSADLWLLPLFEPRTPAPYLRTRSTEADAHFSPDSRWLAFVSTESGEAEVYVAPIDDPGARQRVSTAGGLGPRWRRDGRELVYLTPNDTFMAVPINPTQGMKAGIPRPLFSPGPVFKGLIGLASEPSYDLTPDGQTFLVNRILEDPVPAPITVILNWPALARR